MAILVEAVTVIVRNATLAARYPGGVDGFRRDCPNATYCADEHLSSVSFMTPGDADVFVAQLAIRGLVPSRTSGGAEDVAMANPAGPITECDWLAFTYWDGIPCAWLAGADRGPLFAPAGWSPEKRLRHMSQAEIRERLEFVRSEGNVDVYREKATGKECYVGRTATVSEADAQRAEKAYDDARGLIRDLILVGGDRPPGPLDVTDRYALEHAVPLLTEVVAIFPAHWRSMWMLGKIYQRLEDDVTALEWFGKAHRVAPDQPDAAREAAIAAMQVDRPEEAVGFCERAIHANPRDAGLRSNLAIALLFSQRPEEARDRVREALEQDPADTITLRIQKLIDEVLAGSRKCPRHIRELR
jgi:hypothetical protein